MFEQVFQFAQDFVKSYLLKEQLEDKEKAEVKEEKILIKEAGLEESILKGVVKNWYLTEVIPTVQLPFERKNYIRVSYLSRDFCPVEEVYCSLNKIVRQRKVSFVEHFKMRIGSYIHSLLGDYIELEGEWICRKCSAVYSSRIELCNFCGSRVEYFMREFYDDEVGIKGTPDGIVSKNGDKFLLELKTVETSISDKKFEEAVVQLNLYMHLAKIWKGLLIIFPRINPRNVEEYVVNYDQALVSRILENVKKVWEGLRKEEVPWDIVDPKSCVKKGCLAKGECLIGGKF